MKNIFGFVEMFCIFVLPSGLMATIKTNKMRKQTDLNPWAFLAITIAILYIVNQIENF